jgi:hypothetical protein
VGNVFADAGRADHLARGRAQYGVVPLNQPWLAGSGEDFVLVMPCGWQISELRGEHVFHVAAIGRADEYLEPIPADHLLAPPIRELQELLD